MKNTFKLLIFLQLFNIIVLAQTQYKLSDLRSTFATEKRQEEFDKELENKISYVFSKELNSGTANEWRILYKDVTLNFKKNDLVYNAVKKSLEYYPRGGLSFSLTALEAAHALYPGSFNPEVEHIFNAADNPQIFASSFIYLNKLNPAKYSLEYFKERVKIKFQDVNHPELNLLEARLENIPVPPLKELLNAEFQKGKTIIFSLMRKNREIPGLAIVRKPDGSFVRDDSGEIFSVPQLALSVSNLPGYLKHGNTPQGVFSIVGWYITPTESIGPSPIILTRIPFEKSPNTFFHGKQTSNSWTKQDYTNLLPASWQNYLPIYGAYYAGKSGRGLIIAHGSADNLDYYKDKPYYPLTPSMGCLTTKEIWDPITGNAVESDQMKLANAFFSTGVLKGFLVIVDIDDKNSPVTLKEIEHFIR